MAPVPSSIFFQSNCITILRKCFFSDFVWGQYHITQNFSAYSNLSDASEPSHQNPKGKCKNEPPFKNPSYGHAKVVLYVIVESCLLMFKLRKLDYW